jgi:hypothetical protein
MRFLAYGMIPLGALLAGALGTALGVRDALWIVPDRLRGLCLVPAHPLHPRRQGPAIPGGLVTT